MKPRQTHQAAGQMVAHPEGNAAATEGSFNNPLFGLTSLFVIKKRICVGINTRSALLQGTYALVAQCLQALPDHTVCLVPPEQENISHDVTSPQHVEIGRSSLAWAVKYKVPRRQIALSGSNFS